GGDLGDRVAGRLRRERRRARDTRVHLDHAQLAGLALSGELDVRPARLDADSPDDRGSGIAELLVGLVRKSHLRGDGHRVARVHPPRGEVLDRPDDHDVVALVAHHLELELVPVPNRLLDQHLADRALLQTALDLALELVDRADEAPTVAAEREGRADDGRQRYTRELVDRGDDLRARHAQPAAANGLA